MNNLARWVTNKDGSFEVFEYIHNGRWDVIATSEFQAEGAREDLCESGSWTVKEGNEVITYILY